MTGRYHARLRWEGTEVKSTTRFQRIPTLNPATGRNKIGQKLFILLFPLFSFTLSTEAGFEPSNLRSRVGCAATAA
jgi:hypothetical protein